MLAAFAAICLLVSGMLLARTLVAARGPAELLAYATLFGATAVPFLALTFALLFSVRIAAGHVAAFGGLAVAAAGFAWWRSRRTAARVAATRADVGLLAGALVVAVVAALHYTSAELLLSLASYATRGEARCFYHLTFQLVADLNPGAPFAPISELYDIISTPGNALFSAPFVAVFGAAGFHVSYVVVQVATYLFTALLALRWTGRWWVGALAGLAAVLGPWALAVEVLDRNAAALALTAALVYTVETRPTLAPVHGWLLGLAAGTGLRFLPLLNLVYLAAAWVSRRARPRDVALALGVAAATFALNVPHLLFHGFHSLGEDLPPWELLAIALGEGTRAPLQPLPTGLLYLQLALGDLGALGGGLLVAGLWAGWRAHRRVLLSLLAVLALTWAVLAVQRDWLETDKLRILLWAWLPVPLAMALGVDALFRRSSRLVAAALVVLGGAAAFGLDAAVVRVTAPVDATSDERKPLYQSDSEAFARFYRERFARVGVLPGYGRLGDKLDPARKRLEERIAAARLAGATLERLPPDAGWARAAFAAEPPPAAPPADDAVSVRIDLERLVSAPDRAASLVSDEVPPFVDFVDRSALLDVHYREARVSWQPEPLAVAVFPAPAECDALREVTLHLDAYASFGEDAEGFVRVNGVQFARSYALRAAGHDGGLRALPGATDDASLVVRVPRGYRIALHYWVVSQAKGTPLRVDSWIVQEDGAGGLDVQFRCGEPESYL